MLTADIVKYNSHQAMPDQRYGAKIGELVRTGATAAQARQRVETAAVEALSDSYAPFVIGVGGLLALIYRTPAEGWHYRVVDPADVGTRRTFVHGDRYGDRITTERKARRHLADMVGEDPIGWAVLAADVCTEDDRLEHARSLTFQRKMRALMDAGYSSDAAHARTAPGMWPIGLAMPDPVTVPEPAAL